ncbi:MAG: hypothetical protein Q4C10_01170 [Clostridia bacterium]|nr:hypothetical protein [Clostridia bacterium]
MVGETVIHTRFGRGTVEGLENARISVRFDDGTVRVFAYPAAVERFLTFENPSAAARAAEDLARYQLAASEVARAKIEENRRREEALTQQRLEAMRERRVSTAKKAAANRAAAIARSRAKAEG